jgi:aromatic-amino-acid transaminase
MLENIDRYPGDPILGLLEAYRADRRTQKVNLGVGIYQDATGVIPTVNAVADARAALLQDGFPAPGYLPGEGDPQFRILMQNLILGSESTAVQEQRAATIQVPGGTGALKVGADFLKRYLPQSRLWLSTPTWDNHEVIFSGAGFDVGYYPYYDSKSNTVDFEAMVDFLLQLPPKDIVVLHPCCHNPTGANLSASQWKQLAALFEEKSLFAFFDMAYQGFGEGVSEDALAIRLFQGFALDYFVASSASKIFSLYEERTGSLTIVAREQDTTDRVFGQLKATVRRIYSSPPAFGARIVAHVLADDALRNAWTSELSEMKLRLRSVRTALTQELKNALPDLDWSFLKEQSGMFSITGFTPANINHLRDEYGIYMAQNSRICVAGLNEGNIPYVAEAFARVVGQSH